MVELSILSTYNPNIEIKGKRKGAQELHYEISSLDMTLRYNLGVCAKDRQQTELHQQDYDSNYYWQRYEENQGGTISPSYEHDQSSDLTEDPAQNK